MDRPRPTSSILPRPQIFGDPAADYRLGGLPHVEARIELARDALDDNHGLLQHDQFDPGRHVEKSCDLKE